VSDVNGLSVLCPLCGDEINLATRMGQMVSDPHERKVVVSIEAVDYEHHCGDPATDTDEADLPVLDGV
jgi:hypothetical protein